MTVHICRGPALIEVSRQSLGERWCFSCRKRREFLLTVRDSVEPSYYEPVTSVLCGVCGQVDGDCGFGTSREWS